MRERTQIKSEGFFMIIEQNIIIRITFNTNIALCSYVLSMKINHFVSKQREKEKKMS